MRPLSARALFFLSLLANAGVVFSAERAGVIKSAPAAPRIETHHPIGWRFTMPKGDAAKGRAVFERFECYYCHQVRGENFPDESVK